MGYRLLIPVFFVASGLRFDPQALTNHPSALARVPMFLAALLAARALPALLYRRPLGSDGAVVAGLLQATSLPSLATAAETGVAIGAIRPVTAAALVSAGLPSVVVFPPMALVRLRTVNRHQGAALGQTPPVSGGSAGQNSGTG